MKGGRASSRQCAKHPFINYISGFRRDNLWFCLRAIINALLSRQTFLLAQEWADRRRWLRCESIVFATISVCFATYTFSPRKAKKCEHKNSIFHVLSNPHRVNVMSLRQQLLLAQQIKIVENARVLSLVGELVEGKNVNTSAMVCKLKFNKPDDAAQRRMFEQAGRVCIEKCHPSSHSIDKVI